MGATSAKRYIERSWVVFALAVAALFFLPGYARAASLSIVPGVKNVIVGETFTLSADVSSPDEAMNAASGDISFPSDKLQVLSVSTANSVMNLWIRQPTFSNGQTGGDVHFEGIVLNPGFTGASGNIVTITFEAIAAGDAPISYSSGAVLANDGSGTNILTVMQPGDVVVGPQGTLVPSQLPAFGEAPPGSGSTPASVLPLGQLTITELPGQDPTTPQPIFSWSVAGAVARGITYKARIGNGDWFNASTIFVHGTRNEYQLPLQAPAVSNTLTVVATDPAGNSASSTASFSVAPIESPTIDDFTKTIPATDQLFSVEGSAPTGTTVYAYLQKTNSILTYIAETDDTGHWSVAGAKTMAGGTWKLYAQAHDARGALSAFTDKYDVQVNSWFNTAFLDVVDWGMIALVMILLIGGIVFLTLSIAHQIRRWRVSSNKDVIELEERLRADIQRIEKELDDKKGP